MLIIAGCSNPENQNKSYSDNIPDNTVLLKVDGDPVTKQEFSEQFNKLYLSSPFGKSQIKLDDPKNTKLKLLFKQKAVNDILIKHFIEEEAKKNNISISDAEVSKLYDTVAERMGGKDRLIQQFQATNMDEKTFRDSLKSDILSKKTIEALTKNVVVTDKDAKDYYEAHKLDKFDIPETVKASHIFVSADERVLKQKYMEKNPRPQKATDAENKKYDEQVNKAVQEDIKKKEEKARNILNQVLADPSKFDAIASKESEDRLSALHGGDIGYFPKGKLQDQIDAIVFDKNKVQVGNVYKGVVKTNIGFHIIKVTDHRNKGIIPYDSVKNDLKRILVDNKKIDSLTKFIEHKKKTVKIEYIYKDLDPEVIKKELSAKINTPADQALKGVDNKSPSNATVPAKQGQ